MQHKEQEVVKIACDALCSSSGFRENFVNLDVTMRDIVSELREFLERRNS